MIACQMCGDRPQMLKYCLPCKTTHCDKCDELWHKHRDRQNHNRRGVQAERAEDGEVVSHSPSVQPQTTSPLEGSSSSVQQIIEQKNSVAKAAATIGTDTNRSGLAQAKNFFGSATVGSGHDQFWTPELKDQFRVVPSSSGTTHAQAVPSSSGTTHAQATSPKSVAVEKTVVVIPKKDSHWPPVHAGPSSIQEESMGLYASMVTDPTVSDQKQQGHLVSHSYQSAQKPVPPPRPSKEMKKSPGSSPKKIPPTIPPKPPHAANTKHSKPGSKILEGLMKTDPEVRQVMLDMELEKLESEMRGLQRGVEIYEKKNDKENPECLRMKINLEEKVEEFHVLCEYRVKFGLGTYFRAELDKNLKLKNYEDTDKYMTEKQQPKQAWPDKDVIPNEPKPAAVNVSPPPRIGIQGLQSGGGHEDDVFRPPRHPPVFPLESLGSFQPITVLDVPKPDQLKKHVAVAPKTKWACQFCTLLNESGSNRCVVCEQVNVNPKYVDSGPDMKKATKKLSEMKLEDKQFDKGFTSQTLGRRFSKQEEEKRLHSQQKADGEALMRKLRNFEGGEYDIDQFEIAASHSDDWQLSPFEWLQQYWDTFKENVIAQAIQSGTKDNPNVLCNLSMKEMEPALMEFKDVNKAIEKCREDRREIVDRLKDVSDVPMEDIIKCLGDCKGNDEAVIMKLNEGVMKETLDATWNEEEPDEPLLEADFKEFINNDDIDKERRLRALLVQGRLNSWEGAEMVLEILNNGALDLSESSLVDIIDAARNADGDMERCKSYLQQDCELCFAKFPMNKIRNLVHCECKMCEGCLTENYQCAARDREARHMACPVCEEPDLQNDEAKADTHFQILDLILRNLLDDVTYQLFQKKLMNRHLMKEPNFRWCAHCECGFIFNNEDGLLKMTCPGCHQFSCFNCKDKWEVQHEGLTCEEFAKWKYDNDPELQAAGLARHLHENGIDCPNCNYRYALARGGCMHFICTQCGYEFCCGCNNSFKKANTCSLYQSCAIAGLHCHHPRDCLYYLRDNDVAILQQLLESNDIEFRTVVDQPQEEEEEKEEEEKEEEEEEENVENERCSVMEQKDTPNGLRDVLCGKATAKEEAGLCTVHYKEYLVMLINTHQIDPVEIMPLGDLERQLQRLEKDVPPKRKKESLGQYRKRMQEFIKKNVPLTLDSTRGRLLPT